MLCNMVGPQGSVHAHEIEPHLAKRAVQNLADASHVTVYDRSGSEGQLPASDVVYVSAGATGPQSGWMSALNAEGRLLFPLTSARGAGGMLLIKRTPSDTSTFLAGMPFRYRMLLTVARCGALFTP